MLYFIGFLLYLVWMVSLVFRWSVLAIELIIGWLIGASGFLLLDRRWPAFDRREHCLRTGWFLLIVFVGFSLTFYKCSRG